MHFPSVLPGSLQCQSFVCLQSHGETIGWEVERVSLASAIFSGSVLEAVNLI